MCRHPPNLIKPGHIVCILTFFLVQDFNVEMKCCFRPPLCTLFSESILEEINIRFLHYVHHCGSWLTGLHYQEIMHTGTRVHAYRTQNLEPSDGNHPKKP